MWRKGKKRARTHRIKQKIPSFLSVPPLLQRVGPHALGTREEPRPDPLGAAARRPGSGLRLRRGGMLLRRRGRDARRTAAADVYRRPAGT